VTQKTAYEWLILIYSLPPEAATSRVRVWRRLKKLGAVTLRNSVYILPFGEERDEICQWLCQEIYRVEGEATLLRVNKIENLPNEEIVASFQRARNEEYAKLTEDGKTLLERLKGLLQEETLGLADELRVLERRLANLKEVDYFHATGHKEAELMLKQCRGAIREIFEREKNLALEEGNALNPEQFRDKTWITRPRPHVDRIATAWLIYRFIDLKAKFAFTDEYENIRGGIPFDYPGAEFSHHGEDCTFETFTKRFGLKDGALKFIAEIVHDTDLKDDKFGREEAKGLDAVIKGLGAIITDDHSLLRQGFFIFDALYANFGGSNILNHGSQAEGVEE
jgi:hypothetical protein